MRHATGMVCLSDGTVMYHKYNGTSSVVIPKLYNTDYEGNKRSLKQYANQLLESAEVHYMDLSSEPDRFSGLNTQCHIYEDYDGMKSLIRNIKNSFTDRLSLLENGNSLDGQSLVYVIVAFIPEGTIKERMRVQINHFLEYNYRKLKFVFILNNLL